ncbi:FG-GAP-like repeat-containing protein [Streptomyces cylindrosporus]|uniref:FG-GAP-like repeat-containing protein n=1 Tax=Streptomyces cylindrosporus TaxID=2927583 RepID=A0ABS9YCL6_9ACTN|nr:FG-GAP-like repeat-containing protein [Streptomyces cylindrosporus]MCI3274958.1 FG-GAP-like repeat-containing protein [Streptomyces cylindrosporus]
MRRHALLAATLTTGLLTALPVTTASAAPSHLPGDFNGDGYRDLAVSAPLAAAGSADHAGAVLIAYGSASGPKAAGSKVISQSTSGIPGTSESADNFGATTATGDFNSDGYADLAVGTPNESTTTGSLAGAVTVLWGSKSGLSGGTSLTPPTADKPKYFGRTLAAGDFNGDGRTDLAVGAANYNGISVYLGGTGKGATLSGRTGFTPGILTQGTGIRSLTAGDINGDGTDDLVVGGDTSPKTDRQLVYLSPGGSARTYAGEAAQGDSAAVGDVDGDGYDDIVTGLYGDVRADQTNSRLGGSVTLTYGSAKGPDTSRAPVTISQNTPGVPGAGEAGDWFGDSVALGDINGDGRADLAVGAQHEGIGSATDAGTVTIVPASSKGLSPATSYSYSQNTAGVPGTAETADEFGTAVRLVDTNRDGRADLAVGAPGENAGDGTLLFLRGTSTRLTTKGLVSYGAGSVGLGTHPQPELGSPITG